MKAAAVLLLLLLIIPIPSHAAAAQDCNDIANALPREAQDSLGSMTPENADLDSGLRGLFDSAVSAFRERLASACASAFSMVAVCALIGLAAAFARSCGLNLSESTVELAGICALAALCFSPMGSLFEACKKAIEGFSLFSKALIPAFAATTAVAGKPVSAVASSAAAITFCAVLVELALHVFLPAIFLYIICTAAGLISRQEVLLRTAAFVKWISVSFYKIFLMIFIGYVTLSGIVSGGADTAAVKTARAAISGAVPVLGSVVADASDAILTGAGVLRGAIGIYGFLGACAICLAPFVSALTHYLVFKVLSLVAASLAPGGTAKMVDGIADGCGIALGLLGTCCAVQFIALVVSTVVIPV